MGGWWAGEKAGRALEDTTKHEDHYRTHHSSLKDSNVDYDTARVGYSVGHVAGRNPDYKTRSFDDVEADLRRGWSDKNQDYDRLRPFVREGFDRSSRNPE